MNTFLLVRPVRMVVNLAGRIVDSDNISTHILRNIPLYAHHIIRIESFQFILVLYTHLLHQQVQHLVFIEQRIGQSVVDIRFCRLHLHAGIRLTVQFIGGQGARCSDISHHLLPHLRQIRLNLFPVSITHFGSDKRLDGRLVGSHAEHLHFYSYLIEQPLQEQRLQPQSAPGNAALRMNNNPVGHAGNIIRILLIAVSIRKNKLAALFEVGQCIVKDLHGSRRTSQRTCLHINSLDPVILLRFPYRSQQVIQSDIRLRISQILVDRTGSKPLHDSSVQFKHIH